MDDAMRVFSILCAWGVCFGVCAKASDSRLIDAQQQVIKPQISMAGGDGAASGGGQSDRPAFVLPQVTPPTILPPSAPPQSLPKPDPRSSAQNGHRFEPPHGRTCFSQSETRENIASHRLTEPISALHAGRLQGEALRARLCRWKADEYIYEVSVLRRDGRVIHIYMNARNGQTVGALNDNERR